MKKSSRHPTLNFIILSLMGLIIATLTTGCSGGNSTDNSLVADTTISDTNGDTTSSETTVENDDSTSTEATTQNEETTVPTTEETTPTQPESEPENTGVQTGEETTQTEPVTEDEGSETTSETTPQPDSTLGNVSLHLTDAPVDDEDISGVFVTFTALRYQYEDSWEDVNLSEEKSINLLTLQDGNTTLLNQVELPAGVITHVRFVLDTEKCYVSFVDETNTSLNVPSGNQTGYKGIGGFTIPAGGTVNVTADFDLRKSVKRTGNGKYKLNPTIKIVDNMTVGEITGNMTLDANGSQVIIYAYSDGSYSEDEADNAFANAIVSAEATDGNYTLPWLPSGTYDLVVVSYDVTGEFEAILGYIDDLVVTADGTTAQDINTDTLIDTLFPVQFGGIVGTVTLDNNDTNSTVTIYAYEDGSWDDNESNATVPFGNAAASAEPVDGNYTMSNLIVGLYDLVVVNYDELGVFEDIVGFIDDVNVQADLNTTQDISEGTLTGSL